MFYFKDMEHVKLVTHSDGFLPDDVDTVVEHSDNESHNEWC